jgi:AbiV family abortive infection protein
MAAKIDCDSLGLGACFALAHAAQLLEDAATLYASKRGASSFHLAVMSREELGRFNLLSARRHSLADDQSVDAKEVLESLRSHTKKLRASNFVFAVPMTPEEQAAWKAAIERNDEPTVQRISEEMHKRANERRDREVNALHQRRLKAQYIDLNPNDGKWSRPSDVSLADASTLIRSAMAEIANALIASQGSAWIHAAFASAGERRPEMGPFTHRIFACLAQGDA